MAAQICRPINILQMPYTSYSRRIIYHVATYSHM